MVKTQMTRETTGATRRWALRSAVGGAGITLAACGGTAPAASEKVDTNPTGGGEVAWWIIGGQSQIDILEN